MNSNSSFPEGRIHSTSKVGQQQLSRTFLKDPTRLSKLHGAPSSSPGSIT
ncbi:Hypothetical protein FKW44_011147 [Caligus rogercresseyi]|uniref:Uncharacterized protein n=1 Tax=Caligus rogercresseyi TaxID=217165 RepID=A0A7T8HIL7_CALRO|nr:Hypothetical protein FKW44_011147 [Caligus rogercresseyi]